VQYPMYTGHKATFSDFVSKRVMILLDQGCYIPKRLHVRSLGHVSYSWKYDDHTVMKNVMILATENL
jgi:hypothetical protein